MATPASLNPKAPSYTAVVLSPSISVYLQYSRFVHSKSGADFHSTKLCAMCKIGVESNTQPRSIKPTKVCRSTEKNMDSCLSVSGVLLSFSDYGRGSRLLPLPQAAFGFHCQCHCRVCYFFKKKEGAISISKSK